MLISRRKGGENGEKVIGLCQKQIASKYLPISTKNELGTQFVKIDKSNNGKIFFDPRTGRYIS